jgi:hypothetical protein
MQGRGGGRQTYGEHQQGHVQQHVGGGDTVRYLLQRTVYITAFPDSSCKEA